MLLGSSSKLVARQEVAAATVARQQLETAEDGVLQLQLVHVLLVVMVTALQACYVFDIDAHTYLCDTSCQQVC